DGYRPQCVPSSSYRQRLEALASPRVTSPGLAGAVNWLDSAGLSGGRERWWPALGGTAQQPVTSGVACRLSLSRTTSFLPCPHSATAARVWQTSGGLRRGAVPR